MQSSLIISKSQPSLLLSTTSQETLTSSSILSSNDINTTNIAKKDTHYDQLKEINKINVKLRRKSLNRSSLLLLPSSSSDHSYYMHKINQRNKNQLSRYFNRSSSTSSPSPSSSFNRVKHINPTLNWYSLALRLKQRTRYFNDIQTKNTKLLNSSYNDDDDNNNDNGNEFFIQNTNFNQLYGRQLSENLIKLPPPALSSQRQCEQLNKQRQQQQRQQQQKQKQQHSKSWNDKKLARNLLLEEWKRKSDSVQNVSSFLMI
ncbi:unnamed protein product [Schistosoma curassoni]|uniref:Myb domain-containing protein n=1 Tax=Schistosoma curassoni TaxID=6186 RepID=A0A183JEL5_9TREM|nr:unnamed protein product [Schistosoma curassoni]